MWQTVDPVEWSRAGMGCVQPRCVPTGSAVQACAKRELVGGAKVKCQKSEVTSEVTWERHLESGTTAHFGSPTGCDASVNRSPAADAIDYPLRSAAPTVAASGSSAIRSPKVYFEDSAANRVSPEDRTEFQI
uniref:Uncharacterized protein n=1 Tax=Anopheles melas TaxID=34690 RepID=A0A182UDM7_9DIPT